MPFKDKEKEKEYRRLYYQEHKKEIKSRSKTWSRKNRKRSNKTKRDWSRKNWNKVQNYKRKYQLKRKLRVLVHYGGDPPKCACCGEAHIEFLTVDHYGIKPEPKYRSGDNLYGWIVKNNFPEGFRVLCLNCNFAIGHYGRCPHEDEKV